MQYSNPKGVKTMTINEFKKLLYDAKIEIDNEDFEMLWQGTNNNKKLDDFDDYEIIDITTNQAK